MRTLRLRLTLLPLLAAFLLQVAPATAATLPSGFTETRVAANLAGATAMEFAPDGRLFISVQSGKVRIVKNGVLLSTPFLTLDVAIEGTQGLMGVTFDPNFSSNGFVYVFYTAKTPTVHNRVSRFTASGDVAVAGSELVLLNLPSRTDKPISHDGGDLHFGLDGKLYVSIGDNLCSSCAQSMTSLFGKMLRLNSDGSIPTDNPFSTTATGQFKAIWALGLRNPFKFSFQRATGRMFINDVGSASWEEINEGKAGGNYGWPTTEGATSDPKFTSPIYTYPHAGGDVAGCSITGGAFYNPPTVQFPSSYVGRYFLQDYCGDWIKVFKPSDGTVAGFATGIPDQVDLKTGPDGSLWYLTRIAAFQVKFVGSAPTILSHPSDTTVSAGQTATFSVTASGSEPLTYRWQRNGVDISGATTSTYTLASAQLSDTGARFRCIVTNTLGSATSSEAQLTVVEPSGLPTATITAPTVGTTYRGGDTIAYAGEASDPEDGTLPASAFTWRIDFHHDNHVHPFIPATSGAKSGSFTVPTEGETSANVWFRIHLTVKDAGGQTTSTSRDVLPQKSTLQLATNPPGLQLKLDGQPISTPHTFVGVVGIKRVLEAVSPQTKDGSTWAFDSWSDGGAQAHTISTPAVDTTYSAAFVPSGKPTVLLVAGNVTLSSADAAVQSRLEAIGYQVQVVDDSLSASSQASGKDLVVISSTSWPDNVGVKFRHVPVPVLLWEGWLYDDMGMTGGAVTSRGAISNQSSVDIVDSAHPLAAGLSGNQAVLTSARWFDWGNPNQNGAKVATVPGDPTKAVIFAYEAGAGMPGLNAPARRVGFFLDDTGAASLTSAGWRLFDAAVRWANPAAVALDVKINFQPDGSPVPSGYVKDTGAAYSDAAGSGWVREDSLGSSTHVPLDIAPNSRDRNLNPDQRLDTLLHMQYPTTSSSLAGVKIPAAWEYAVGLGTYSVTVAVGDAKAWADPESHTINLEGANALTGFVPTGANGSSTRHRVVTVTVTVTDGRLTVDAIGGTNTKINYIEIKTVL